MNRESKTIEGYYARSIGCFGEVDHDCVGFVDVSEGVGGQVAGNGVEGEGVVGVVFLGVAVRTHKQQGKDGEAEYKAELH